VLACQPELLHGTECVLCESLSNNFASASSQNYSVELSVYDLFRQYCQHWQPELLNRTDYVRCENLSNNFASAGSQNYSMELSVYDVKSENLSNNFARGAGCQNYSMVPSVYDVKTFPTILPGALAARITPWYRVCMMRISYFLPVVNNYIDYT
jgi:hypothetical protein